MVTCGFVLTSRQKVQDENMAQEGSQASLARHKSAVYLLMTRAKDIIRQVKEILKDECMYGQKM